MSKRNVGLSTWGRWKKQTMRILKLMVLAAGTASAAKTMLGVSTSSYQIEGAWNEGGRTPSVWDTFCNKPYVIRDGSNGDVACDHYHHWEEDLDWVQWLGAGAYRFSISWSRLLPDLNVSHVNPEGYTFYNNIIDSILARNITPLVTLWHWDSPQSLQDQYGTWLNDQMIDDFEGYARVCFSLFGDRVKNWITLNEPLTAASLGFGSGVHAPGVYAREHEAAHRMIRAHARVYHMYHKEFEPTQHGRISIALNSDFVQPQDPSNEQDRLAAHRGVLWRMGWFADPLFFGQYPEEMRQCGLPAFTTEDNVKDTLDFFSLNHYTTLEASPAYNSGFCRPQTWERFPASSKPTTALWLHVYPDGIAGMIKWLQDRYHLVDKHMDLVITESGVATEQSLNDDLRVEYLQGYIQKALDARDQLGLNLTIYCVWSLLDNFEWAAGYTERYGVVDVDFSSPERKRTAKKSAEWLRNQTLLA